jgi:predicted DNA-binding transcriptional regulator AlpA
MSRLTLPLSDPMANGAVTHPAEPAPKRPRRRLSPLVADAKRLSRLLGVGVRSIRTWDYSGKLPRPIKLGSRTVWNVREIRDWLGAGAPCRAEWEAFKNSNRR